ncbi:hypothetical protein HMPREF9148_00497 [Prevotella sp. F0091]|nr:hypothetical protein HMPREF9148_00497 [Prevotella sp. F0091]
MKKGTQRRSERRMIYHKAKVDTETPLVRGAKKDNCKFCWSDCM